MRFYIRVIVVVYLLQSLSLAAEDKPFIAPYLDDKAGAFSFTFDDGFRKEVADTTEIIELLEIRGTFFLIPFRMEDPKGKGAVVDWKRAKELQEFGHEIGTHDLVKYKLHELSADQLESRVNESWRLIVDHTGVAPVSYARPGGSLFTDEAVKKIKEHHFFLRDNKHLPKAKVMSYGSTGNRKWDDHKTREKIEEAMNNREWIVSVVHSIVGGYSPFSSKEEFKQHCEFLKSIEDRLWIAPMGTVGRYVFEREAAQLKIEAQSAQSVSFTLGHTLENKKVFDLPLTVVIPVKDVATAVAIDSGGNEIPVKVRGDQVLITSPVDSKPVKVTWQKN